MKGFRLIALVMVILLTFSMASGVAFAADAPKIKVALLLPGSLNDGGWNANAYQGLMALKDKGYEVAFTESVAISAIEEAFNNYAAQGYNLVVGHGFEFGEPALRVAPQFPDVKFFVSGKMPDGVAAADIPANVGFMDMKEYEAAYLAGIVAAGVTKTNKIGYVAGMEIPSQLSNLAAFVTAVAKYNPEAKVYGIVTGTFEDPAKGQEAAKAQIELGAGFPLNVFRELPTPSDIILNLPAFGSRYLHRDIAYCIMHLKCGLNDDTATLFGIGHDVPMQCWEEVVYDLEDRPIGFCKFYLHPEDMVMSIITKFNG